GRGAAGVAISPREDGREDHRHQDRLRRLERRRVPERHAVQAALPGPVGDPGEALMIDDPGALFRSPNALAPHYKRFRVSERLLLTGHSHQAWPDRAEIGQRRAWQDAAEWVDAKWERAFERADRVREGFARLLDASPHTLSLGTSTHELLVKWLSALPLRERPCVVSTDSEFHSARRQLDRLRDAGIRVVRVASAPADSVGERLAAAVDDGVAAVIASSVFYDSGEIAL